MARKNITDRRAAALAKLEAARQEVAKLESEAAERIGKIAVKAGLIDLDLSEDQLAHEFENIAARFRHGKAQPDRQGEAAGGAG